MNNELNNMTFLTVCLLIFRIHSVVHALPCKNLDLGNGFVPGLSRGLPEPDASASRIGYCGINGWLLGLSVGLDFCLITYTQVYEHDRILVYSQEGEFLH